MEEADEQLTKQQKEETTAEKSQEEHLIHSLADEGEEAAGLSYKRLIVIFLSVAAAGVLSGYLVSYVKPYLGGKGGQETGQITSQKAKEVVGIKDKETFKDSAEGTLREGGIDGEGQFHLEREGGESQNVYLTSTTVDLSKFIGKKVRIWGETFAAEKAGWLMDVGLVEVL